MTAQVQNSGLAQITAALSMANYWLQWGTGSGATKTANTVTTTSTTEARSLATVTTGTTAITDDKLVLTATVAAVATRAITELGVFDQAGTGSPPVGGTMLYYGDFAVQNLKVGNSIVFTVNITFASGA